jgi:hypothetical protein
VYGGVDMKFWWKVDLPMAHLEVKISGLRTDEYQY